MITDIMLDIETLDTKPTAVVLSIGAVAFNANSPCEPEFFYAELGNMLIIDQLERGRTESEATKTFWNRQPKTAQVIFKRNTYDTVSETLVAFKEFLARHSKAKIWGCGSDFDNVIITSLLDDYGYKPWQFWRNRCFRTIKSEFGNITEEPQRRGTLHHALDDAKHQARWLMKIYSALSKMSDLAIKAREAKHV